MFYVFPNSIEIWKMKSELMIRYTEFASFCFSINNDAIVILKNRYCNEELKEHFKKCGWAVVFR